MLFLQKNLDSGFFFFDSKFISSWKIFLTSFYLVSQQAFTTVWKVSMYLSQPGDLFLNCPAWKMGNLLQAFCKGEKNVFH